MGILGPERLRAICESSGEGFHRRAERCQRECDELCRRSDTLTLAVKGCQKVAVPGDTQAWRPRAGGVRDSAPLQTELEL